MHAGLAMPDQTEPLDLTLPILLGSPLLEPDRDSDSDLVVTFGGGCWWW